MTDIKRRWVCKECPWSAEFAEGDLLTNTEARCPNCGSPVEFVEAKEDEGMGGLKTITDAEARIRLGDPVGIAAEHFKPANCATVYLTERAEHPCWCWFEMNDGKMFLMVHTFKGDQCKEVKSSLHFGCGVHQFSEYFMNNNLRPSLVALDEWVSPQDRSV